MRYIDAGLKARIEQAQQTLYANADPRMLLWISRATVPLTDARFLETAPVETRASISAVSVTARRPHPAHDADRIYALVSASGTARLLWANLTPELPQMTWATIDTISDAPRVAVAFDGRMVKSVRGTSEFITVGEPWVFWIDSLGVLRGKQYGSEPVVLAESNATAVAAVRGHRSESAGFDQGLIVFFLLDGVLYYRSLIDGEWTDGHPAGFGPSGTWVDLTASRTWVYRIVVQLVDASGRVVELITRTEGIAKQNTEHLEVTDVKATAARVPVTYYDTDDAEHIEVADIAVTGALPWGATENTVTRAENVNDGAGDWGRYIEVEVEHPWYTTPTVLLEDVSAAQVIPQDGVTLTAGVLTIEVSRTLEYGINGVTGDVRITLTNGTNEAGIAYDQMVVTFAPTNLVPPVMNPPELEDLWNE